MSYVTESQYKGSIPAGELDSYLSQASDMVDVVTFRRIAGRGGLERLTTFQQECVRKAVCLQADYLYEQAGMPSGVQSYSVGDVSLTVEKAPGYMSENALSTLRLTGLTYRGL